jgi:hypothetical protein
VFPLSAEENNSPYPMPPVVTKTTFPLVTIEPIDADVKLLITDVSPAAGPLADFHCACKVLWKRISVTSIEKGSFFIIPGFTIIAG